MVAKKRKREELSQSQSLLSIAFTKDLFYSWLQWPLGTFKILKRFVYDNISNVSFLTM